MRRRQELGEFPRARRRGRVRGAALVEYALAIALIAVVAQTGIRALEDSARDELDNQADCISTRPPPPSCQQAPLGTTTTTTGGTTTTGVPPTADPVATVTTGAPVVTPGSPLSDVAVDVDIDDDVGDPVVGEVVTARITVTASDFNIRNGRFFFVDCTTDAAGQCTESFDSRWPEVTEIRFEIVTVGIDTSYDIGTQTPITIDVSSPAPTTTASTTTTTT